MCILISLRRPVEGSEDPKLSMCLIGELADPQAGHLTHILTELSSHNVVHLLISPYPFSCFNTRAIC